MTAENLLQNAPLKRSLAFGACILLLSAFLLPLVSLRDGMLIGSADAASACLDMKINGISADGRDGSNVPSNTIDNDLKTRWSNYGKGAWIRADLGENKTVCYVDIAWYKGSSRQNTFDVSVSFDGVSYKTIYSGKSTGKTTSFERYDFADVIARYIKITVFGNTINDWASITEMDVYGHNIIDATAPNVIITDPIDGSTVASTSSKIVVKGTAADNIDGSGIKTVEVKTDDGAYITAIQKAPGDWSSWTATVDVLTSGPHRILPRATDNTGNQAWNSIYVTVEIQQPSDNLLYDDFEAGTYQISDGQTSPNGKWLDKYNGYGGQRVKEEGSNNIFYAYPKTSTTSGETHASLTVSSTKYANAQVEWSMRTDKQLRTGSSPNSWEVAWGMIKYVDSTHHYYIVVKPNGQYEFGKKDYLPAETGEHQIFLKTGSLPSGVSWELGRWYDMKAVIDGTMITVDVDGKRLFDFKDDGGTGKRAQTSVLAGEGSFGMYEEDAAVAFDDVHIKPL
jgi:hypothetical protein